MSKVYRLDKLGQWDNEAHAIVARLADLMIEIDSETSVADNKQFDRISDAYVAADRELRNMIEVIADVRREIGRESG